MKEISERLEAQATAVHDQHLAYALAFPGDDLIEHLQEVLDHAKLLPDGPPRALARIAVMELAYAVGVALIKREAGPA